MKFEIKIKSLNDWDAYHLFLVHKKLTLKSRSTMKDILEYNYETNYSNNCLVSDLAIGFLCHRPVAAGTIRYWGKYDEIGCGATPAYAQFNVFVEEFIRQRGYGSKLIKAMTSHCINKGWKEIHFEGWNPASRAFFKSYENKMKKSKSIKLYNSDRKIK